MVSENCTTVGGSNIVDFLLKINITSKLVESSSVPVCKPGSVFVVLSSSGHLLYQMVKSCVYQANCIVGKAETSKQIYKITQPLLHMCVQSAFLAVYVVVPLDHKECKHAHCCPKYMYSVLLHTIHCLRG